MTIVFHRAANIALFTTILALAACTTSRPLPDELVTVEGVVTVRGNEPFAAYVLETDENNRYVLQVDGERMPDTPASLRVTGRLYRGSWDGRPFAFIEVHDLEPAP